MTTHAISAQGLSKRYSIGPDRSHYQTLRERLMAWRPHREPSAEIWALDDVSFAVEPGEVFGIIGKNGAGKSTLLKVLSRITSPTRGTAEIRGRVGSLLEVGTGFHPELTGRENIFLNAAILGMKRRQIARRFDEIVAFSEVEKFLDTPVKRYSSGMYLRLAFAVAAHMEPDVLLVDEVLAVGDASFQRKCLGRMSDVSNQGRTVLFVSHNLAAVAALCSKGMVLSRGSVSFLGDVNAAIRHYTHLDDRPQEDRSDAISLTRVRINGQRSPVVLPSTPFTFSATVATVETAPAFKLFLVVENESGQPILHAAEFHHSIGDGVNIGTSCMVELSTPPLWLKPGSYAAYFKAVPLDISGATRVFSDTRVFSVRDESDQTCLSHVGTLWPAIQWRASPT